MTSKDVVVVDRKHRVTWHWYGGHYIHGMQDGKELYLLSTGDMSKDSLTETQARDSIQELMQASSIEDYRVVP